MLRTIRNLLILILIGITASGMPIYASNVSLHALIPTIISKDDVIIVNTEENIISSNHVQIKLAFSSNSDNESTSISFDENNPFAIELKSNEHMVQNIALEDLLDMTIYKSIEIHGNDPTYIVLDFDQEKLDLPNGSYDLKIVPHAEGKQFHIDQSEFNLRFSKDGDYVPALATSKQGQTPLTLYFPDEELNILVPITRFVPYTTSPLTMTLRNLEKGPASEVGLFNGSPIPSGGKAGKVGDMAYINLPSDAGYNQGSAIGTTAVHSLVNSMTSVDGISKVQFQINGKIVGDAFHGLSMDQPYNKSEEPMIYTAYLSPTNRYLLAPISFGRFDTLTEQYYEPIQIPAMFERLKYHPHGIYTAKIHPLVPSDVELLDYELKDGILTLTFNEAFHTAYEDHPKLKGMMMDGIVFTFESLEEVNFVSFKVRVPSKDSDTESVIVYDHESPVYINPEK